MMILIVSKKKVRKLMKELWISNYPLVYGKQAFNFGEKIAELCALLEIYDEKPPCDWEDQ